MGVKGERSEWEAEDFGESLVAVTVGDLLDAQAQKHPDKEALVYRYPEVDLHLRLTYAALCARADRVARGLLALGIARSDKVAVLATNVPEWVLLEFALAKIGAVLVTVNTNSRKAELEYLLRQADVRMLFLVSENRGNDYLAAMRELVPEVASHAGGVGRLQSAAFPVLEHLVLLDGKAQPGFLTFPDVEALARTVNVGALRQRQTQVSADDVFQIQFTSGTTGAPKGAMITHRGAVNNARFFAQRAQIGAGDRLASAMPLFHTAGSIMEVLGVVANAATLVKAISFDAAKLLELIHTEKVTVLSAVPTMVIAMLQHPGVAAREFDTTSLRCLISGGTPIPVSLMEEVRSTLGALPTIGFGMTETSPMVTATLPSDSFERKSTTVGIPLPHTHVKIADESGNAVALGEPGELLVRGYLVMKGYYALPEQTAKTIDAEGWLHSGDLATMDRGGYIRIVGRIKDMIIRGGENVYPAEVESFLMRHPAIKQVQVVGVPDPYMGEEGAAFVQLRHGAATDEETLRAYCRASIARHKVPKYFRFVDEFPLTPSGKVKKSELRSMIVDELASGTATTVQDVR